MCIAALIKFINSNFIATISGGLIGGLFTYLGVRSTIKNEYSKMEKQDDSEVKAFCQAIQTELECLLLRYMATIGGLLDSQDKTKPFIFYYPITEDYFTVYHSNAHLIGKIKDTYIRTSIVSTYTNAKGHIDGLKYNNELVKKYEDFLFRALQTKDTHDEMKRDYYLNQLTEYVVPLIQEHQITKEIMSDTIAKIKVFLTK